MVLLAKISWILLSMISLNSVNTERFAGLNFCGFEVYRESVSVNVYELHVTVLFKYF